MARRNEAREDGGGGGLAFVFLCDMGLLCQLNEAVDGIRAGGCSFVGDTTDRDEASICVSQDFRVGRATSGLDGFGWPARSNVPRLGRIRRPVRGNRKRERESCRSSSLQNKCRRGRQRNDSAPVLVKLLSLWLSS